MLLFETKLSFASSCRSTWPRCNTVYCRWGRYDTTDITNLNEIAAARVSQESHTLKTETQGNGLSQGINQAPQGIFESSKISGNSQGMVMADLSVASENVTYFFLFVLLSVSWQNDWKKKPFTNSPRVNICCIYLPMVNWWMACILPNNGLHFHFMKIFMLWTLQLIDVINVSHIFYRSYLLQILPAFSK